MPRTSRMFGGLIQGRRRRQNAEDEIDDEDDDDTVINDESISGVSINAFKIVRRDGNVAVLTVIVIVDLSPSPWKSYKLSSIIILSLFSLVLIVLNSFTNGSRTFRTSSNICN